MTAYAQWMITRPSPHGCPDWQRAGYGHQLGNARSCLSVEHMSEKRGLAGHQIK
jgi:hypothetical protein